MHQIVVCDGIVLSKRPAREADTVLLLLTERGLLRARAQSARAERSKLRYGLEPLSRARYSMVLGKHEWRLTGVERVSRDYALAPLVSRQAIARIARLLLRLMPGEEPAAHLYRAVTEGFEALRTQSGSGELESIEVVLVLRILSCLGYLPHSDALAPFVEGEFSVALSAQALQHRALLVRAINESLRATGL